MITTWFFHFYLSYLFFPIKKKKQTSRAILYCIKLVQKNSCKDITAIKGDCSENSLFFLGFFLADEFKFLFQLVFFRDLDLALDIVVFHRAGHH